MSLVSTFVFRVEHQVYFNMEFIMEETYKYIKNSLTSCLHTLAHEQMINGWQMESEGFLVV